MLLAIELTHTQEKNISVHLLASLTLMRLRLWSAGDGKSNCLGSGKKVANGVLKVSERCFTLKKAVTRNEVTNV